MCLPNESFSVVSCSIVLYAVISYILSSIIIVPLSLSIELLIYVEREREREKAVMNLSIGWRELTGDRQWRGE